MVHDGRRRGVYSLGVAITPVEALRGLPDSVKAHNLGWMSVLANVVVGAVTLSCAVTLLFGSV